MDISICIVTYNHERFIAQAIESVLMQVCPFSFEIVVTDDCSVDATPEIVKRYAGENPDKFRVIRREKNVGGTRNFALALPVCRGDYVALLDGDDYWISPTKLQRQFEFLESHPRCVACFHSTQVIYEDPSKPSYISRPQKLRETYELCDLLMRYELQTGSAMFRRASATNLPDWYPTLKIGDRTLFALLAEQGSLGYIDEVMSVYRVHSGGLWSGQDRRGQWIDSLAADDALARHFKHRHDGIFGPRAARMYCDLARGYEKSGDDVAARKYAILATRSGGFRQAKLRRPLLRMLARFGIPPIYNFARAVRRKMRNTGA